MTNIHPAAMSGAEILNLPVGDNEAGAETVREYLVELANEAWQSAKRFQGESGWRVDIYTALVKAGLVEGELDEDGYLKPAENPAVQRSAVDRYVTDALIALAGDPPRIRHVVTITLPDAVGHWSWNCTCGEDASGYDDPDDVAADAGSHGWLAADSHHPSWEDLDEEK